MLEHRENGADDLFGRRLIEAGLLRNGVHDILYVHDFTSTLGFRVCRMALAAADLDHADDHRSVTDAAFEIGLRREHPVHVHRIEIGGQPGERTDVSFDHGAARRFEALPDLKFFVGTAHSEDWSG